MENYIKTRRPIVTEGYGKRVNQAVRWVKRNIDGIRTDDDLSERIKVSRTIISRAKNEHEDSFSETFPLKLCDTFPQLNVNYILYNEGELLNPVENTDVIANVSNVYAHVIRDVEKHRAELVAVIAAARDEVMDIRHLRLELMALREMFIQVAKQMGIEVPDTGLGPMRPVTPESETEYDTDMYGNIAAEDLKKP